MKIEILFKNGVTKTITSNGSWEETIRMRDEIIEFYSYSKANRRGSLNVHSFIIDACEVCYVGFLDDGGAQ